MGKNREYAERLKALEGYERKIIAFKLCDEVPAGVEHFGDDLFLKISSPLMGED
jgi:hypothetical protein